LKENGDMVNGKQAAIRPSDNYEDVSYITVNMEHQREAIQEQIERNTQTPDPMKECLTSNTQPVGKKVSRTRWSHKEMLAHLGNSAICKLLEIYGDSWSLYTLIQI